MKGIAERILSRIHVSEDGCWLWTGNRNTMGYGSIWYSKRKIGAHRFIYELMVGPIPKGLVIDHLCRVHNCVNPAHLEPVTDRINTLRGVSVVAAHAKKSECPAGHPYDEENTYRWRGRRYCRLCQKLTRRRYYKEGRLHAVRWKRDQLRKGAGA